VIFIIPGRSLDPDHLLDPLHVQPGMGVINSVIFRLTAHDGRTGSTIRASASAWRCSRTSGNRCRSGPDPDRRPARHPARAVRGGERRRRLGVAEVPLRHLAVAAHAVLTSTILSMIWTLGDFNSVYLLTGGGPADLTHVLATLGIRYIRLDQVDLAMATIVCAMPLVLPLMWFMMKNLSRGDRQ